MGLMHMVTARSAKIGTRTFAVAVLEAMFVMDTENIGFSLIVSGTIGCNVCLGHCQCFLAGVNTILLLNSVFSSDGQMLIFLSILPKLEQEYLYQTCGNKTLKFIMQLFIA